MEIDIKYLNKSYKSNTNNNKGILNIKKGNNKLKTIKVLKDLNLKINEHEVFGLIGENGAGKSTLLNCLGTLNIPDSGSIVLSTKDYSIDVLKHPQKAKQHIIFSFQDPKFDPRLSVEANLDFHLRMYQIQKEMRKKLIKEHLEKFSLYGKRNNKFFLFSGGQKKQIENIRGFILAEAFRLKNNPFLLITDEPTAYCDYQAKNNIWRELLDIASEFGTVLFATNDLNEAEYLTNRKNGKIGFIKNGSISFTGNISELKDNSTKSMKLLLTTSNNRILVPKTTLESLELTMVSQLNNSNIKVVSENNVIFVENINEEEMNESMTYALEFFSSQNIDLDKVERKKTNLNDLFIN